jgi:hypothetical protein
MLHRRIEEKIQPYFMCDKNKNYWTSIKKKKHVQSYVNGTQ